MQTLDNILSGGGEAASAQDQTTEEQVTQAATEGEGQTEQPAEGHTAEGEGDGGHKAPIAALQDERQKVRSYKEELAKSTTTLEETRRALEESRRFNAELAQRLQPKQEPQQPPDFFENPQAATQHELQRSVSPAFEQINQTIQAIARDAAISRFDEAKVNEAEQAFLEAMQSRRLDPSDYQRVASSPNRYAAAVQWHQRQQARAEVGDDPAAFKARVEAEIREKVLAEINGGNGQQQTQQRSAPVTPSNLAGARNVGARTGPAWSGPKALDDIFAR
jgi:hypothetical protein